MSLGPHRRPLRWWAPPSPLYPQAPAVPTPLLPSPPSLAHTQMESISLPSAPPLHHPPSPCRSSWPGTEDSP